jgi:hypothetical protein
MIDKAASLGLCFQRLPAQLDDIHTAVITDSHREFLKGFYRFVSPRYYRPIGTEEQIVDGARSTNLFETVDRSVFERMQQNPDYRPKNIINWTEHRGIDWQSCAGSFDASTGGRLDCKF